jgi:16S rRNA (guanine527-N7)-methyltransferase
VVARGFGPPEWTLRHAVGLLADQGRVVISEPPAGDRWRPELLAELGVSSVARGSVRIFEVLTSDH